MKPQYLKTTHRLISTFGERNQKMQAIEELMELQKALFENVHRGTANRSDIVEEVADVEIMLAQIKEIFDIRPHEIEDMQEYKLDRAEHTIEKYLNKKKQDKGSNKTEIQIDRDTSNGR